MKIFFFFFLPPVFFAGAFPFAGAADPSVITFPVEELGNCASQAECKTYCDVAANRDACTAFAKAHGLIKEKKAGALDELIAQGGPGGCKSEKECKTFCADPANQDVCLQFATDNNLISKEKIAKIKKFKDIAIQGGPGGCKGQECRMYCADAYNQDECLAFAKTHGLINAE